MTTVTDSDLDRMFRNWAAQSKKERFIKPKRRDPRYVLADSVVDAVVKRLSECGYTVTQQIHNAPFDLDVQGLHIEVKASLWNAKHRRYQAQMRNHDADVIVFCCVNSRQHFFVIPSDQVTGRTIEIRPHDPRDYHGKWARYYDAWQIVHQAIHHIGG